jgi:hypothetical protein
MPWHWRGVFYFCVLNLYRKTRSIASLRIGAVFFIFVFLISIQKINSKKYVETYQ